MKVVPAGVQIGGVRVGGLTSEQARNAISLVVRPAGPLRLLRQALDRAARGARRERRHRLGRAARAARGRTSTSRCRPSVDSDAVKRYVRALDGRLSVEPVDATAS